MPRSRRNQSSVSSTLRNNLSFVILQCKISATIGDARIYRLQLHWSKGCDFDNSIRSLNRGIAPSFSLLLHADNAQRTNCSPPYRWKQLLHSCGHLDRWSPQNDVPMMLTVPRREYDDSRSTSLGNKPHCHFIIANRSARNSHKSHRTGYPVRHTPELMPVFLNTIIYGNLSTAKLSYAHTDTQFSSISSNIFILSVN